MATLYDTLHQELALFRASLETERIKRRAILTADGKRLQTLTQKTESLLGEIAELEKQRALLIRTLLESRDMVIDSENVSLSELIELAASHEPQASGKLRDLAEEYRIVIRQLKLESEENQRLLQVANDRVHSVLTGLAEEPDSARTTYAPREQSGARRGKPRSALINASA
ncbi:MAG: flagellar protein FlgN [Leptospirales bacterium]|nr:flagellar protein FlgN [Leptospirales bacterium]